MASASSDTRPASPDYRLFFADPRLRMTIAGRMFVRAASYVSQLLLVVLAFVLLLSRSRLEISIGILLVLFLADMWLRRSQADKELSHLKPGRLTNVTEFMSPEAFRAIEKAFDKSRIMHSNFFLEVLQQLVSLREPKEAFLRLDVPLDQVRQKLDEFLPQSSASPEVKGEKPEAARRQAAEELAINALESALASGRRFLEAGDLLVALCAVRDEWVVRLFGLFNITAADMQAALLFAYADKGRRLRLLPRRVHHKIMNRAWTSRPTPTLDNYGTDLTDLARIGYVGLLVGHEAEYRRLVDTLARPINPNALLIGEAGAGKRTIAAHLAAEVVQDRVPKALFDRRVVELEIAALVAGAAGDELTERIARIVQEIEAAGNVILYIPDIHNLAKTTGEAYISAADALMPVVMSNEFPVIGATYPLEFKQHLEQRSDFTGAFEIIRIAEITEEEAQQLLIYEALGLEKEFKVTISFAAIKEAVKVAHKYLHGKLLPASAAELLKETIVDVKQRQEKVVGLNQVIRTAETKVNVPIHEAGKEEAQTLLRLEEIIHEQFVGQDEAVKAVATALREYRSGLNRPKGPIASFLFVGPTGVGKTELAKILAKLQFGSEQMMVRFDMTEFQDKPSFYRFIGSPDRQVSGLLTDAVLQKPYSLILLDEFEKAYPDIHNLFLQVLDEGRLTDNLGRTVDFQNTIVIATSNAHSDILNEALSHGEAVEGISEYLKKRLVDVFKPELLNRFSKVVVFRNLEPAQLVEIAKINLQELAGLVEEQGIQITVEREALEKVAKLGYDPAFGARPLRRVIEDEIRAPLAKKLLLKEITRGSRIKLVVKDDRFDFVNV